MYIYNVLYIVCTERQLVCTSENFIAITLGSIVAKLFYVVILSKEQNALAASNLQFGFKQHMCYSLHICYDGDNQLL